MIKQLWMNIKATAKFIARCGIDSYEIIPKHQFKMSETYILITYSSSNLLPLRDGLY